MGPLQSGTCYAEGRRETILRPRVRKQVGDGTEREHVLASYRAIREPSNNAAAVVTALRAGMSTRSQAWANEGVMSKTAASRHWIAATAAKIAELRERDLSQTAFFGIMLDGVFVGDDAVVVVALGLTCTGEKMVLDFEVGSSENAVVSTALTARLQRRGFGPLPGSIPSIRAGYPIPARISRRSRARRHPAPPRPCRPRSPARWPRGRADVATRLARSPGARRGAPAVSSRPMSTSGDRR